MAKEKRKQMRTKCLACRADADEQTMMGFANAVGGILSRQFVPEETICARHANMVMVRVARPEPVVVVKEMTQDELTNLRGWLASWGPVSETNWDPERHSVPVAKLTLIRLIDLAQRALNGGRDPTESANPVRNGKREETKER
jgi:hypothetical protein